MAQQDESPIVIFYEAQNASGTATLHITQRAEQGEAFDVFFARVTANIHWIDPTADLKFVFKDAKKGGWGGNGGAGGGAKVVDIPNNQFVITHVEKRTRPNKKMKPDGVTPGDPWIDIHFFGANGETAKCFYGSGTWVKPIEGNPVLQCGLFPNVAAYAVGERKAIPAGQVWIAHVHKNDYREYEVDKIIAT